MTQTGRVALIVSFAFLASCGGDDFVAPEGTTLALSAGNNQVVQVAAPVPTPLAVLVEDITGNPVAGIPVTWTVVVGGGTIVTAAASGADGIATATYQAGTTAGPKSITASINGATGSPITFSVTAQPGPAARVVRVDGDAQSAAPGAPLAAPLRVQVHDQFGNGVAGQAVTWSINSGGGSIAPVAPTSDADGYARATYTAGGSVGSVSIAATAAGLVGSPVVFGATVSNAALIQLVSSIQFGSSYAHDIFVRSGLAFVSAWGAGLQIYDVGGGTLGGSAADPRLVGSVITNSNGVSGGAQTHNAWWYWAPGGAKNYVFVGQEGPQAGGGATGDIHVVDVSNMGQPIEVAYYHMSGLGAPIDSSGAHNFWVDEVNEILYAAYYQGGVVALDISGTLSGNLASREIARIRPGGVSQTFTWGVMQYQGSVYAADMESGFWQLKLNGSTFSAAAGGHNVPERLTSDLWVSNGYAYTGTWAVGSPYVALKIWQLDAATGAPALVDSIPMPGVFAISDVEVSADGRMLMFSTAGGATASNSKRGIYFYSLVGAGTAAKPAFIAHYPVSAGVHTTTFAEIGGRRYVFAMRDPPSAVLILDVTAINP